MKKVFAIVLALVMAFSFVSVVSAADIAAGQIFIGAKADVTANPGESAIIEYQLNADASPSEGIDQDGTLYIEFSVYTQDVDLAPIKGFELTSDAIEAGATIEEMYMEEDFGYAGRIALPAVYLFGTDIVLANIIVNVSEDWEIVDYEAAPLALTVGADYVYVESDNGDQQDITYLIQTGDANITYQYQPTAKERLIETLKAKARAILETIEVALNYVKTLLNPALWNKGIIK